MRPESDEVYLAVEMMSVILTASDAGQRLS